MYNKMYYAIKLISDHAFYDLIFRDLEKNIYLNTQYEKRKNIQRESSSSHLMRLITSPKPGRCAETQRGMTSKRKRVVRARRNGEKTGWQGDNRSFRNSDHHLRSQVNCKVIELIAVIDAFQYWPREEIVRPFC